MCFWTQAGRTWPGHWVRTPHDSPGPGQDSDNDPEVEQELRELLESPVRSPESLEQAAGDVAQTQPEPIQAPGAQPDRQSTPQIHYSAQAVPKEVKKDWSQAGAALWRKVITAAATGGDEHERAKEEVQLFPSRILGNTNGSYRRKAKVQGNLKRYKEGTLPQPKPISPQKRKAAEQRVARQVQEQLVNGNVTRACRALEASEVADTTPENLEKLSQLRPDE